MEATADNEILMDEVIEAIKELEKGKASGFDSIPAEYSQVGREHIHIVIQKFAMRCGKLTDGQTCG